MEAGSQASGRRLSRVIALSVLFSMESGERYTPEEAFTAFCDNFGPPGDEEKTLGCGHKRFQQALSYARELFIGIKTRQVELDHQIAEVSDHWRLSRMSRVDRNILRLAAYEMLHCRDIPTRSASTRPSSWENSMAPRSRGPLSTASWTVCITRRQANPWRRREIESERKPMRQWIVILAVVLAAGGCGYTFDGAPPASAPFGIHSVTVPPAVNATTYTELTNTLTNDVIFQLTRSGAMAITSSDNAEAALNLRIESVIVESVARGTAAAPPRPSGHGEHQRQPGPEVRQEGSLEARPRRRPAHRGGHRVPEQRGSLPERGPENHRRGPGRTGARFPDIRFLMEAGELEKTLETGRPQPVYLLHGPDRLRLERCVDRFAALVPEEARDFNLHLVSADESPSRGRPGAGHDPAVPLSVAGW